MDAHAVILNSVGEGGSNQTTDVRVVQRLLNDWLSSAKQTQLKVDGRVGPKTIGAIVAFQRANTGNADGRVDPGRHTINLLLNQHLSRLVKSIDVSGFAGYVDKSKINEAALADPALLPLLNSYIAELRKSA